MANDYIVSTQEQRRCRLVQVATRRSFLENHEKMTTLLDSIRTVPLSSGLNTSLDAPHLSTLTNHHLPRLDLPKFDGTHTEWLTFRDLFSSMVVENHLLSPVEKLHYLRTSHIRPAFFC